MNRLPVDDRLSGLVWLDAAEDATFTMTDYVRLVRAEYSDRIDA
jgi:hypothetical protein